MVKFFPDLDFIQNVMRPKPEPGEWWLLNRLKEYLEPLPGDYEVYFQGNLNGNFPDVVIMRKDHGALIIEVKDWHLEHYRINFKDNKTWFLNTGDKVTSPIAQAKKYKDMFYEIYSSTLARFRWENASKSFAAINTAVFFYNATAQSVKKFFGRHYPKWVEIFTPDDIENQFKNIYGEDYFLGEKKSTFFNGAVYTELERNLRPSEHGTVKRLPKNLNPDQRRLIQSRANVKQKVRGPAGCGKTLVLANRAVNAYYRTHEPVLILTFNITLRNFIRDNISLILGDIPKKRDVMNGFFYITHYHAFLSGYLKSNNVVVDQNTDFDSYELEKIDNCYQTILVDEVQDYKFVWVDNLHKLLEPGGELVFFCDEEQKIYDRKLVTDGGKNRVYTGVGGNWNNLKQTYRLEGKIANLARAFQLEFFKDYEDNVIEPAADKQLELVFADETLIEYYDWEDFDPQEIVKIFKRLTVKKVIHNDDICILSQTKNPLRYVDKCLRDSRIETATMFAPLEDYQEFLSQKEQFEEKEDFDEIQKLQDSFYKFERSLKYNFQMESGKVKLSTIHSYKGWSVGSEILILADENRFDEDTFLNDELVYTAITRAKNNLVIVNIGNERYHEFFKNNIK